MRSLGGQRHPGSAGPGSRTGRPDRHPLFLISQEPPVAPQRGSGVDRTAEHLFQRPGHAQRPMLVAAAMVVRQSECASNAMEAPGRTEGGADETASR